MMSVYRELRKQVKQFLSFSAGERIATLVLFSLLLLLLGLMYFLPYLVKSPSDQEALQLIQVWENEKTARKKTVASRSRTNLPFVRSDTSAAGADVQLFMFDPNTITEMEAVKLGFTKRQIKNVLNYRAKGGVFRKKSDLAKLYSFDSMAYARLQPYIRLPETFSKPAYTRERIFNASPHRQIEINTADSVALVQLKGVGPYTASRILRWRNRLGGFVHLKQLKEVWGINDSFYQIIVPQLTIDLNNIQKVQINTATPEVLKQHPYIWRWSLAKAIVSYREQHGRFRTTEDLKPIVLMHDSILQKLEPYLDFD